MLTIKQLYGILISLACIIIKIAVGSPVIVHSLKLSLTSISKREFLSFIDEIIKRVNKETDIPGVKGSAHLSKEHSL